MAPYFDEWTENMASAGSHLCWTSEGETRAVDVFTSRRAAPNLVPTFTATPYMNFFTSSGFVMLYPDLTLNQMGMGNFSIASGEDVETTAPWQLHRYNMSLNVSYSHPPDFFTDVSRRTKSYYRTPPPVRNAFVDRTMASVSNWTSTTMRTTGVYE